MKKILLILFILGIVLNGTAQEINRIELKSYFPKVILPGQSADLIITITKPRIQPYAVYEQAFPSGFSVEAVDVGRGMFKFEDNKVLISWIRLPSRESVSIKLKVKSDSSRIGSFSTVGMLNYLHSNRKGIVSTDTIRFDVNASAKSTAKEEDSNVVQKEEDRKTKVESEIDPPSCDRTISRNGQSFIVKLHFSGKNEMGTVRITETIPPGYSLKTPARKFGAYISSTENEISFVWDKLNEAGIEYAEYEVYAADTKKTPDIKGQIIFSYHGKLNRQPIKNKQLQ